MKITPDVRAPSGQGAEFQKLVEDKPSYQFQVLSSQLVVADDRRLDLLQSLHVMHAGNLTHAVDDVFQMLQVGNVEHDVDIRLTIVGAGFDIADVGLGVADHGGYLLQHPETIVAKDGQLHRIRAGRSVVLGPFHINPAFRFIQQVGHVGTIDGMDRDPLAASHVTDDGLASNRITTAGPVYQQVAVSLDANGVVVLVAAEDAPHHAGKSTWLLLVLIGQGRAGRWRHASQYLSRRIFAVPNARHQVVGTPRAVVGCNLLQFFVLDVLQRYPIFARFFLDQFA